MKILENSYPRHENVEFAEVGDEVKWTLNLSCFELKKLSNNKTVFSTAAVDKYGNLISNGKSPVLLGIIAQVKSKNWKLIIGA